MNLRIRNGKHCSRQIVKEISTKYEGFSDNLPMQDYYEFNKSVVSELIRISHLTFYNVQFLTGNKSALFKLIGEFSDNIKEFIIWDKMTAEPAIGEGVLNSRFEVLLVFSDKSNAISRKFNQASFSRGTLQNLWQIKRGKKIDKSHGAVFPEELAQTCIENFSKTGDVVFDPFMGLGTSGVVAKRLGRSYIGVEMNENYFNLSKSRIDSAQS
jgi:site-specific DNA-methyltransferase (adenine-specific)/modification methylase